MRFQCGSMLLVYYKLLSLTLPTIEHVYRYIAVHGEVLDPQFTDAGESYK